MARGSMQLHGVAEAAQAIGIANTTLAAWVKAQKVTAITVNDRLYFTDAQVQHAKNLKASLDKMPAYQRRIETARAAGAARWRKVEEPVNGTPQVAPVAPAPVPVSQAQPITVGVANPDQLDVLIAIGSALERMVGLHTIVVLGQSPRDAVVTEIDRVDP